MSFLLLAAFAFIAYFSFKYGDRYRAARGIVAGFIGVASILTITVLRAGAERRLHAAGVVPHPAIVSPNRLTVGLGAGVRDWSFSLSEPGEEALEFYRDAGHLSGWRLAQDESGRLVFTGDKQQLIIMGSAEPTLLFRIVPDTP